MPGHAIVKRLEEKRREILRLVAPHRHATATAHSTHGRHASRRGGGGGDSDSHRNPYRLWKRVRDLRLGSRSQQVYLLENPRNRKERVVLKRYDASDRHHRGRYDKELKGAKTPPGLPARAPAPPSLGRRHVRALDDILWPRGADEPAHQSRRRGHIEGTCRQVGRPSRLKRWRRQPPGRRQHLSQEHHPDRRPHETH